MTVLVIAFVETAVRPPETAPQQPQTYRYEDMPRAGSFSSCGGCVTADVRLG
ncbi:MAG: hypothetical protein LRZ85_08345 [Alphaproteobacteria bacterium]|nr:hypothetical protein [Alphaproteobacteria bacterium]MCD8525651.1 hypothetical protein [Alphaproteobacteria bacterium]MCD8570039.1 hypothetical protein [Alphaproteobacteria bacterium]